MSKSLPVQLRKFTPAATIAVLAACAGLTADAQFIEGVTILDGEQPDYFGRRLEDLVEDNGLSDDGNGNLVHDTNAANMWLSDLGQFPSPFVVFDLGLSHDLSAIDIWNYNEGNHLLGRNFKDVTISMGATAGSVVPLNNGNNGVFTFDMATGLNGLMSQTIDISAFSGADEVRIVRIDMIDTHPNNDGFAGLSKVRFTGIELAPPTPGDVTGEGTVNLADFQIISDAMFTNVATRAEGDLTGDGIVDFDDYREWKDIWDSLPATAVGEAVPEPTTWALGLLAACGASLLTARKSRSNVLS